MATLYRATDAGFGEWMGSSNEGTNEFRVLEPIALGDPSSYEDIVIDTGLSHSDIRRSLRNLFEAGYIYQYDDEDLDA